MCDPTLHCCYKTCKEQSSLDARIEVKTVLPNGGLNKTTKSKFLVNWKQSGEAEFHTQCWEELLTLSKARVKKSATGPVMVKEEKALVKAAAEAPEQFDSLEAVLEGARRAAKWIRSARHCVTFTGAGISTSAGIGDYRGKSGKWTEEDQNHTVDMATVFPSGSRRDGDEPPTKKTKQDESGEEMEETKDEDGVPYEKLRPTYTHEALMKLMDQGYLKYVISQNGDGLHGLSGIPHDKISELHGNVFVEVCELCGERYVRQSYVLDDFGSQYYEEIEDNGKASVKKPKFAKKCDLCGLGHRTGRRCEKKGCSGHLKDSIINFRDLLEEEILDAAWEHAARADVMLCLGTTLQVTPACDLVKKMKKGNKLVICNRQETPVDRQFERLGPDGAPVAGCRVFGDCDQFMKEVMRNILPAEELEQWEGGRAERMVSYDNLRD